MQDVLKEFETVDAMEVRLIAESVTMSVYQEDAKKAAEMAALSAKGRVDQKATC